jgi:enterochelin esterase family protein
MLYSRGQLPRLFIAIALAMAIAASPGWPQTPTDRPDNVSSPRLRQLRTAIAQRNDLALAAFWEEIRRDGAPLIERATDDRERLVTFLWRYLADARVVVLTDFGDFVPHVTLERLPGTDVWHRSVRLPVDARFLYEFSVNDPAYPFVDGDTVRFPSAPQPDPLNKRRYDFANRKRSGG